MSATTHKTSSKPVASGAARQLHARHPVVRRVAATLRRRIALPAGARLALAVSGGADSVAMCRVLDVLARSRRRRLDLHLVHVHHHLRRDGSDEEDAQFVRALAERCGRPFHRRDLEPLADARASEALSSVHEADARPANMEASARVRRYAALREAAETVGAGFVATAHHADDQLETLLLRIGRGSGLPGLRGVQARRPIEPGARVELIRPMLDCTAEQLRELLRSIGQPWREDPTNAAPTGRRNAIRQKLTPAWHEIEPDVARRVVELAAHVNEVERFLADQTEAALHRLLASDAPAEPSRAEPDGRSPADSLVAPRARFRALDRLIASRVLRRLLIDLCGESPDALRADAIERLLRAIVDRKGGTRRFRLGDTEARIEGERVTFGRR